MSLLEECFVRAQYYLSCCESNSRSQKKENSSGPKHCKLTDPFQSSTILRCIFMIFASYFFKASFVRVIRSVIFIKFEIIGLWKVPTITKAQVVWSLRVRENEMYVSVFCFFFSVAKNNIEHEHGYIFFLFVQS